MSSGVRANPDIRVRPTSGKRKTEKLSHTLLIRTLFLLSVCGVAAFILLAFRLYDIQITNNAYYEARTLSSQLRETTINASRGTIYDTNGKILAMSGPVENVFISPREISEKEQDVRFIAEGLSYILGVDFLLVMERAARTSSQYQVIKPKVDSNEAQRVREFIKDHSIKGIYLEPAVMRYYPNDHLASHLLGFVGTEDTGLDGLERRFNSVLTGVNGRDIRLTNAKGADLMLAGFGDYFPARHGYDITLTLNTSIQYYIEKHLQQAIIDYDVKSAMCIAIDTNTFEILALANYPTFDPNNFLRISDTELDRLMDIEDEEEFAEAYLAAQYRQWRNRSLSDSYEPGSVFKIITLAMVLEENKANPDTILECDGSIEVRLYEDVSQRNCWRRWGHGSQTLSSAIHNSCNVACVKMGLSVGAQAFYKYIDAFGLFDKTGLDNAAEGRSLWWPESIFFDRGNETQLASASFGQTFKVTPIQMITAAAATINGGYMMQPYLVKQVTDSEGNILEANEPTMLRQVLSNETSAAMRTILEDVVNLGTGKNAHVRGYKIGGKTGTSENVEQLAKREEGDTSNKDYIASFIGFAPADDPQIMILLLLDTPSHDTGIYISGGNMAAPVVGKMFADILPMSLGILPEYSDEDFKDINVHVPRITGRSVDEAIEMLELQGFAYKIVGESGVVTGQLPVPNANVASGTQIVIYTNSELPRHPVIMPNLYGMNYQSAKEALAACGLFIRTTGAPKSDSKALVSVQSISIGREVLYGSVVEVTLIDADASERRIS
ncbi:MAG: penicillin-binding transpeptidase domain-containing protein [Oscillospiraceae bacterium]|nr:penicillin-binding transpeptidase domain-containing protein [Oscillospiraceae bacterium]